MTCGIYVLKHILSGRCYVGQSRNIERRWRNHICDGKSHIGAALRKYGAEAFQFEILEVCGIDSLNALEIKWVAQKDCVNPKGFNLTCGGNAQKTISETTREKMRKISQAMGVSRYAQLHTRKAIEIRRQQAIGRKVSDEWRANISAGLKGRVISPEASAKAATKLRGRKLSAERVEQIRQASSGRVNTFDTKLKMALARGAKLYTFVHEDGRRAERLTPRELREQYGLTKAVNYLVKREKLKSLCGWRVSEGPL